uniref:Uncharacterized protein n=1 Tax=Rhizophora mucronata TaxID=61149 RepID=A0A2P2PHH7_RHIMU
MLNPAKKFFLLTEILVVVMLALSLL